MDKQYKISRLFFVQIMKLSENGEMQRISKIFFAKSDANKEGVFHILTLGKRAFSNRDEVTAGGFYVCKKRPVSEIITDKETISYKTLRSLEEKYNGAKSTTKKDYK